MPIGWKDAPAVMERWKQLERARFDGDETDIPTQHERHERLLSRGQLPATERELRERFGVTYPPGEPGYRRLNRDLRAIGARKRWVADELDGKMDWQWFLPEPGPGPELDAPTHPNCRCMLPRTRPPIEVEQGMLDKLYGILLDVFKVTAAQVTERRRNRPDVLLARWALALALRRLGYSYTSIAITMKRDPSNARYSFRRAERIIKSRNPDGRRLLAFTREVQEVIRAAPSP